MPAWQLVAWCASGQLQGLRACLGVVPQGGGAPPGALDALVALLLGDPGVAPAVAGVSAEPLL